MVNGVPPADARPPSAPESLTAAQLNALSRFPDANPNPVLRLDGDGRLIYANPASAGARRGLDAEVGDRLDDAWRDRFARAGERGGFVEVVGDNRTYALWPVPIEDLGFVNVYGMASRRAA